MTAEFHPHAWRAYRVPGERHYPRRLREGEYVVTDSHAALTIGEEIVVLTATGKRLIAMLIGYYDENVLILSGLEDQDDGGVWVDAGDIAQTEAVVMFYFRRDRLPPGVIYAGDLSAPS